MRPRRITASPGASPCPRPPGPEDGSPSPQADKARGEWQSIDSAPINTAILLWNNETCEMVIGHKPPDGPHEECVVVSMTAAYADAWHPLPDEPESEDEDATPQPQGDASPEVASDECPACHKAWGEHRSGYSASRCQMKPATPQVSGEGFTAADMMDARAEERSRLSGSQVSGGGEGECPKCGAPTDPDYGHVGDCPAPAPEAVARLVEAKRAADEHLDTLGMEHTFEDGLLLKLSAAAAPFTAAQQEAE